MVTMQYAMATGMALLLVIVLCNALTNLYVRAAVRDALDDGVRAGVPRDAGVVACQSRVDDALRTLVRGAYSGSTTARCNVDGVTIVADATVRLPGFIPLLIPDWSFELRATARSEEL